MFTLLSSAAAGVAQHSVAAAERRPSWMGPSAPKCATARPDRSLGAMAAQSRVCGQAHGLCCSREGPARRRAPQRSRIVLAASRGRGDDPDEPPKANTRLEKIIRRKQAEVAALLDELGQEALEERLRSATRKPASPPHRLAHLIADIVPTGRPVLVFELSRGEGAETSAQLGQLAEALVEAGADALAVKTDSEDTPEPLKDLLAVTQAAAAAGNRGRRSLAGAAALAPPPPPPVLQRDWFLHPIQVVNAKEAGVAGIIGVIASVTSRGTPVMSSFAAAIGLDAPVEIVNMQELRAMEQFGVPFFACNLSVGLSVSISGFGLKVAEGLLGELPFAAISLVGAKTLEEARQARVAGADAVLVKWELVRQHVEGGGLARLVGLLKDITSLDD